MGYELGVVGATVMLPTGTARIDVGISEGRFAYLGDRLDATQCERVVDAAGLVALPGMMDAHNHPYYDDDIVEFATSAAYGGLTAMLSFAGTHMNRPGAPQTAIEVTEDFISRARPLVPLDFGVHTIVGPGDDPVATVRRLKELGVTSVKLFLAFPGRRMLDDATILAFMQAIAANGMLCMVHCENGPATELLERQARERGATRPLDYAASRPIALEAEAINRALTLAEIAVCPCYIVHVTGAEPLAVIERFRQRGRIPIYVETCPHYLLLDEADLDRLGGLARISPPIRSAADVEALWQAVSDGAVDVIASDCSGQLKAPKLVDDIFEAPYGIPGVEQMLPLMWHHFRARGIDASLLVRSMAQRPAEVFGLETKGRIEIGLDADLVLIDPDAEWTIHAADQHGNSDYSLYEGWAVRGKPVQTFTRGRALLDHGTLVGPAEPGHYLAR